MSSIGEEKSNERPKSKLTLKGASGIFGTLRKLKEKAFSTSNLKESLQKDTPPSSSSSEPSHSLSSIDSNRKIADKDPSDQPKETKENHKKETIPTSSSLPINNTQLGRENTNDNLSKDSSPSSPPINTPSLVLNDVQQAESEEERIKRREERREKREKKEGRMREIPLSEMTEEEMTEERRLKRERRERRERERLNRDSLLSTSAPNLSPLDYDSTGTADSSSPNSANSTPKRERKHRSSGTRRVKELAEEEGVSSGENSPSGSPSKDDTGEEKGEEKEKMRPRQLDLLGAQGRSSSSPSLRREKTKGTSRPKRNSGTAMEGPIAIQSGTVNLMCKLCGESIHGNPRVAMGFFWHMDHFKCFKCDEKISGPFFNRDGKPWCQSCQTKSSTCTICNETITSTFLPDGKGGMIHPTCKPPSTFCFNCKNGILGDSISVCDYDYHPECFSCYECKKIMDRGSFAVKQGLPVCDSCMDADNNEESTSNLIDHKEFNHDEASHPLDQNTQDNEKPSEEEETFAQS